MGLLDWLKKDKVYRPMPTGNFYDRFSYYRSKMILPEKYEPGMNCFIESVEPHLRQAVYEELKNNGGITIVTDASGQNSALFSVSLLRGQQALEKVTGEEYSAFSIDKKELFRVMFEKPDLELALVTGTNKPIGHIEKHRLSDITLDSEPWFTEGAKHHGVGRYKEAIESYNKAIEIEPLDARAWNNKAAALLKLARYQEALECCNRAIEIAPKMAGGKVWANKAEALEKLGRYEEAIACYDKALGKD